MSTLEANGKVSRLIDWVVGVNEIFSSSLSVQTNKILDTEIEVNKPLMAEIIEDGLSIDVETSMDVSCNFNLIPS